MKYLAKWIFLIFGGILLLVLAILLIVPQFIDIKPTIEEKISQITDRPFKIEGELKLSLFPWAGISLSDLKIGNPEGFQEEKFIYIKEFDARVKFIPLLFKDIHVKRFIVKNPTVLLIRKKNGQVNWDISSKTPRNEVTEKTEGQTNGDSGLPFKSLQAEEFLISDGSVMLIDHSTESKRNVSDISAKLDNISLHHPISVHLQAQMGSLPLSLKGDIGPLGENIGKNDIPLNITVTALNQLRIGIKGILSDIFGAPGFNLELEGKPFSPKQLFKDFNKDTEINLMDPEALENMSFNANLQGGTNLISMSKCHIALDDSIINVDLNVKKFEKPDLSFHVELDQIDLDRYLPRQENLPNRMDDPDEKTSESIEKINYKPLRKLVLNGTFKANEMKINNVTIETLLLKLTGNKGIFKVSPFSFHLYKGKVDASAVMDINTNIPKTSFNLAGDDIMANPLFDDLLKKDIIDGVLKTNIDIQASGDTPETLKKSLDGNMNFLFKNGAIKGIDLTAMVRNIKTAFNMTKNKEESPRTDFSEFHCPFIFKTGIAHTTATRLVSPLLRVNVKGQADIVKEKLDFRMEPKFVATFTGQGDIEERSGIMIPILIKGSFSSPKFLPDLESVLKQHFKESVPVIDDLKNMFKNGKSGENNAKDLEETVKDLLENIPFGK